MEEKELAINVITRAIKDLIEDRDNTEECLLFLLGQTDISKFWFMVAGVDHLKPKDFDKKNLIRIVTGMKSKLSAQMKRERNGRILD